MLQVEGLKDTGFKGQFRFLKKPAPWLILGATALGNGGVFCWYSYITPLLTEVSGFSADSITALMVLAGFGMVVGNLVSGRMSDRYTPGKVGTVVQGMICVILLLIFLLSPHPWCSAILMTLCTAGLFAVSSPEQVLMIRVAPGGEMLGGACVQMAFNLGNAIGAYIGGLALSGGYHSPGRLYSVSSSLSHDVNPNTRTNNNNIFVYFNILFISHTLFIISIYHHNNHSIQFTG